MSEALEPRHLFGGAVDVSIPKRFVDISDFRPIPDHQEVFTDANLDQSIIVEIVEYQSIPDNEACEFYFNDLVQSNDAMHHKITSIAQLKAEEAPLLPATTHRLLVSGEFSASKGRQGAEALNKVNILLLVVRIPEKKSDMLITLNSPVFIHENSAAAQHTGAGYKDTAVFAPELFRNVVLSLNIKDLNLFC